MGYSSGRDTLFLLSCVAIRLSLAASASNLELARYFPEGFCWNDRGSCSLLSSILPSHEGPPCKSPEERLGPGAAEADSARYILRFNSYRRQGEHEQEVEEVLSSSLHGCGYMWITRVNAASDHPTDFGLMEIRAESVPLVKGVLELQPWFRALNRDSRITRRLNWLDADLDGDGCNTGEAECVRKPPGRLQTSPTIGLFGRGDDDIEADTLSDTFTNSSARHLMMMGLSKTVPSLFQAEKLWAQGYKGGKVRMGVFDTGIREDHPHVKNIEERSNWTHEPTLADGLGHGSFVAGVISSQDGQCPGFAPDVALHTFRVFTNDQVSYTSWFLDAFNYAIATDMNVVNLSIGGPDYLDEPFVDKVLEITSHGMIMVSAIGNDGPNYGTLNNPADQNDVIGVGGIDFSDNIAAFSSRGMSTWELPGGYGRAKPDVVAYGKDVSGSKIQTGCRSLSGTSVASPVVAGAVCLLASVVPEEGRWKILNPASMKQALVEGAVPLNGPHMFEQGQGKINLINSMSYRPRASAIPGKLDLTACPFMWPFCKQPLYSGALPVIVNLTVMNGMGARGKFASEPKWKPSAGIAEHIDIRFSYSKVLWPWSGFLALYITIRPSGSNTHGTAKGNIEFTITSPAAEGEGQPRISTVTVPFTATIIPTPKREMRIIWDQFHSIRYPPGYIPRDNLDVRSDILDWHGDHPHTNYKDMFNFLVDAGYYIEVLGRPFTCFDASNYGTLLLVDSEEEYYPQEIEKIRADVETRGLGLIVFAEWYNKNMLTKMRFFDDNTRTWWTPYTGGANIPALNDLLAPYGIAFGDAVLTGMISLAQVPARMVSGANIIRFPEGGYVHSAFMQDRSSTSADRVAAGRIGASRQSSGKYDVLGIKAHGKGRVAVFGDSNCLDSSHQTTNCYLLLRQLLEYTSAGRESTALFTATSVIHEAIGGPGTPLPERRSDVDFTDISTVLNYPASCGDEMDHAAYDRRTIFQQSTQEGTLLRRQGITDLDEKAHPVPLRQETVPRMNIPGSIHDHKPVQPTSIDDRPPADNPLPLDPGLGEQQEPSAPVHLPNNPSNPPATPGHMDGTIHKLHMPVIMGKDQADVSSLSDVTPHFGHMHVFGLVAVGVLLVLLLMRVSRRQRSSHSGPRLPGSSRAFRKAFSP